MSGEMHAETVDVTLTLAEAEALILLAKSSLEEWEDWIGYAINGDRGVTKIRQALRDKGVIR